MKNLISLARVLLFLGITTATLSGSQDRDLNETTQGQFVGAWRLAWLEEQGLDGKIRRADCIGQLIYTGDGHMAVQVMYRNPPANSPTGNNAVPGQYAQDGYEASFGKYEIDGRAHTFTFRVEGALVRNLIGKDLKRAYEFSGNQLIVKSYDPDEHWRVAWEHD